jgi:hypothetical protein
MQYKESLALSCIRKQKYQKWIIHWFAKSFNAPAVGTFSDICLNLGQLSPYNFKICMVNLPEI